MTTAADRARLLALLGPEWTVQPYLVAQTGRPLAEVRRDLRWLRARGLVERRERRAGAWQHRWVWWRASEATNEGAP